MKRDTRVAATSAVAGLLSLAVSVAVVAYFVWRLTQVADPASYGEVLYVVLMITGALVSMLAAICATVLCLTSLGRLLEALQR